jgi:large subunit ribosomal protein L22
MTGPKLNEAPVMRRRPESRSQAVKTPVTSTRAVARYVRISPYKVRQVLDLIRGYDVERAREILKFSERDAAIVVGKLLASAVANAEHDHAMVADELFVSACYADEGPTLKRWRPRARGRATRIRKRTCHVTLLVSRLPDRELQERRARRAQGVVGDRRRRRTGGGEAATEQRGRPTRRPVEERTPAPEAAAAPPDPDITETEMEALAESEDAPTTEEQQTTGSEEESK